MARKGSILPPLVPTGLLLVAVAACLGAMALLGQYLRTRDQIPFESEGWHDPMSDSEGFTGTRLKMVDDLLKRYDFHDWSRQDLQDMLGNPYWERVEEQGYNIEYDLRDGLNLLIFELDNQHRVIDYHVWRGD